jgi:hypothetical protein
LPEIERHQRLGKEQAVKKIRLPCQRFRSIEVLLWLSVIAYNQGNLRARARIAQHRNDEEDCFHGARRVYNFCCQEAISEILIEVCSNERNSLLVLRIGDLP